MLHGVLIICSLQAHGQLDEKVFQDWIPQQPAVRIYLNVRPIPCNLSHGVALTGSAV